MEFIQFHPTSLYAKDKEGRSFLISEAVRGEGGILLNSRGEKIMEKVHPMKDLAPRDIVARTIDSELKKTGDDSVFIDITSKGKEFLKKRFPTIYTNCLKQGIDISTDPIPVVPAAHYLCGGVITDINGRTNIRNLYVSGESSCTGVHGANRLASNSLLEGVVFSHRSFLDSSKYLKKNKAEEIPDYPDWSKEGTFDLKEWILVNHNIDDIKRLMWDYVGIVRSDMRLEKAYRRILMLAEEIHDYYRKSTISPKIIELRNLATVAKLIIKCAMTRKDSIGLHYNIDHIESGKNLTNVVLRSGSDPSLMDSSKR
jgi:L-aspartate oxidase